LGEKVAGTMKEDEFQSFIKKSIQAAGACWRHVIPQNTDGIGNLRPSVWALPYNLIETLPLVKNKRGRVYKSWKKMFYLLGKTILNF